MDNTVVGVYLFLINLISGLIFTYDKYSAIKNRQRISERKLHFFEILGGVFANLILLFLLRHKNRKFAYWFWTCCILILWIIVLYFYIILK